MSAEWVPLSKRHDEETAASLDALHEGVPPWLQTSLFLWIKEHFRHVDPDLGEEYWDTERLLVVQRVFRLEFEWGKHGAKQVYYQLQERMRSDPSLMLDVIDFILSWYDASHEDQLGLVDAYLQQSGSAWRVRLRNGRGCLERRVDDAATAAARLAIDQRSKPATHLALAWTATYARDPNPGHGYGEAVKAVEAAAQPIVLPDDAKATLGKMIAAIRDAPQKWGATLPGGVEAIRAMMEALWTGQRDRHGSSDENVPTAVSQQEVEAALHLAITLCHWLQNGFLRRVQPTGESQERSSSAGRA